MIRTVPLKKLMPSPRNVRRTTDEQADLQLKADIEARGLLQNLVVAPARKPKGRFTVEVGGRRFRALVSLAKEGKLAAAHEVCCLVLDGGPAAAQEAGLAENFQRLAMNPADECLAFQQLIEQGADVEGIARRFGLTVRFVEGRLRLASLAPVVFDALGAGEITLDVAKAYAATRAGRFDAFRALPDEARAAWLGHASARTLEASLNLPGGRTCPFHDHLGRLLGIDVAKWWRPTGANFFDRVPKSVTLAALEKIGGAVFACGYSKSKKAELSETAERIFAGSVAPKKVKKRALAWVPEPMRFAPAPQVLANVQDEAPPWEDSSDVESKTVETGSGAEEDVGGGIASPASSAAEGEGCADRRSSGRRRGIGKEADGDVPPVVLEEAA